MTSKRQAQRSAHEVSAVDRDATAIHEAGHAVLYIALRLGIKAVTIAPDIDDMTAGTAPHGGEWGRPAQDFGEKDDDTAQLRSVAEDAFWLRHAICAYASVEAVRQLRPDSDPEAGADSDRRLAVNTVTRITDDTESIDLYYKLAVQRCKVLVEHYAPEIEALAAELLSRETLTGDETRELFCKSLNARRAGWWEW
jgi:ATP-dependent Zn protease